MPEIKVSTESLRQEAENVISNINKMKNVLEEQKGIIRSMSAYWEGEGLYDRYRQLYETVRKILIGT